MKLDVINNAHHRNMYVSAKAAFVNASPSSFDNAEKFWKELGEAYDMRIIKPIYKGKFPVVEALEFNTEEAYSWFLLRFS